MSRLEKFEKILTRAFDIFFGLIILAVAVFGAFAVWLIVGMLEYGLLPQIGGAFLGFLVGAAFGWLGVQIMKILA